MNREGMLSPSDFRRLRAYWDEFYARPHPELERPSNFAEECVQLLPPGASLFEVGCGNGRDALFFAATGLRVIGCDLSPVAVQHVIAQAAAKLDPERLPTLFVARLAELAVKWTEPVDAVYLRFVLHTVTRDEAAAGYRWAYERLRPGSGLLLIEARSVHSDLYGVGQPLGDDAFYQDGHYRRFVRTDELKAELRSVGFHIEAAAEGRGLAVMGQDDPVVVRIVARAGRLTEGEL